MSARRIMGYRASLRWMVDNDDTEWARNDDPVSVTAVLVADIFGVDDEKVRKDLRKMLDKEKS